MKNYSHVITVFSVVAVALLGMQIALTTLQSDSFGKYGRFRGDHILEASSLPLKHKGDDSCLECHENEWDMADAKHAAVPCENCHFLPKAHAVPAADGGEPKEGLAKYARTEKMPIDSSSEPCKTCHLFLPSRPAEFPQVKNAEKHIKDGWKKTMGELDVKSACPRCHNSHFPKAFAKVSI